MIIRIEHCLGLDGFNIYVLVYLIDYWLAEVSPV